MTDAKTTTEQKMCLYSNPNINKEIIEAAAKRDVEIINAMVAKDINAIAKQEEIQKVIREEKRSDDNAERERKESEEKDTRERADTVWTEMQEESKCCLKQPFICKKIILLLLITLEIAVLIYWAFNPTTANFEELIAPILLVGILFTLIILLGNTIVKEDRELAKAKAEMLKEAFMRRLK